MDVGDVLTLRFTYQIVDFVALRTQPGAEAQNILLDAVRLVE